MKPLIYGHRGSPFKAPENTIASIKKALEAKFEGNFSQEIIDANIRTIQECFDKMQAQKQILQSMAAYRKVN